MTYFLNSLAVVSLVEVVVGNLLVHLVVVQVVI